MKKLSMLALVLIIGLVVGAAVSARVAVKTYQVTGPVLELRPDAVVVQKGTDKWEIARDAGTKVTGDLKVGSRVTIQYRMTATDVAVAAEKGKAGAAEKPAADKAKKK
jgi:hypothetical protein